MMFEKIIPGFQFEDRSKIEGGEFDLWKFAAGNVIHNGPFGRIGKESGLAGLCAAGAACDCKPLLRRKH